MQTLSNYSMTLVIHRNMDDFIGDLSEATSPKLSRKRNMFSWDFRFTLQC